jgi:membrane associated rhomboid family serine protease
VLPLKDNVPTRRRPVVTWLILAVNVAVYLFTYTQAETTRPAWRGGEPVRVTGADAVTMEYGFVPCELTDRCERPNAVDTLPAGAEAEEENVETVRVPEQNPYLTLLTSMFMHGGLLHLVGNMLFLWIFGNNVEDAMGRLGFLVFYLLTGIAADLAQLAADTASDIPTIGASGAISGVLGAYILLYPRARVLSAVTLIFFIYVVEVPAVFLLGLYFVLQVLEGASRAVSPSEVAGGVAYFAHIGGFVAGFLLVKLFARRRHAPPPRAGLVA